MSRDRVQWNNGLYGDIAGLVVRAVDEIDLEVVNESKKELYPNHGQITGTLKRSLHMEPAQIVGTRVRGALGSNLIYARRIHELYHYIQIGLERAHGRWPAILRRNIGR